jgi:hypothetical protein
MAAMPKLRVERVAQLEPGELFLVEIDHTKCFGFMCDYSDPDQTKLALPLGPKFPRSVPGPRLTNLNATGVSFGKDFTVCLPVDPEHWSADEPPNDCQCLVVVGTDVYFRADGSTVHRPVYTACYVNIATGVVEVMPGNPPGRYARPSGTSAYATVWEIVTTEPEPRPILRYSYAP